MRTLTWTSLATLAFTALWPISSLQADSTTWTTDTKEVSKTQVVKEIHVAKETYPEPEKPSPTTYPTNAWDFRIGLPLWATGLNGDVGVHGKSVHVSDSFTDILDTLDFAAALNIEARKCNWLFYSDGLYSKTSTSAEGNGSFHGITEASLKQKQWIQDIGFGYAVYENPCTRVEAILGTRINYLESDISLTGMTAHFSDSASKAWADPIIGMRAEYSLANCTALYFKGDVGGFGAASDLTYQLEGGFDFTLTKHCYARLAYRYLSTDFSSEGFLYDASLKGPQIELGLRF